MARPDKMRTVKYYRCWDDMTWDIDEIDIPAYTPPHMLNTEVQISASRIVWCAERPLMVGIYSSGTAAVAGKSESCKETDQ